VSLVDSIPLDVVFLVVSHTLVLVFYHLWLVAVFYLLHVLVSEFVNYLWLVAESLVVSPLLDVESLVVFLWLVAVSSLYNKLDAESLVASLLLDVVFFHLL